MRSAFSSGVVKSMEVVLHSIDFISTGFSKFDCRERDFFVFGRTCPSTCKGRNLDFSKRPYLPGRLIIGRSYEAKGVLADAGWYFYDQFHFTYFAAWTEVDIDTGEFQHHFFERMSDMG